MGHPKPFQSTHFPFPYFPTLGKVQDGNEYPISQSSTRLAVGNGQWEMGWHLLVRMGAHGKWKVGNGKCLQEEPLMGNGHPSMVTTGNGRPTKCVLEINQCKTLRKEREGYRVFCIFTPFPYTTVGTYHVVISIPNFVLRVGNGNWEIRTGRSTADLCLHACRS